MPYEWPMYFCLFLALWSAIIGGTFSAFSEFIMKALLRTMPAAGIESMQHINRTVIKTQFVAGILSISLFSVLFGAYSVFAFKGAALVFIILAAIIYIPTVFLMTMLGNVPLNNKLERLDHTSFEAKVFWFQYGRIWNRLNHVRSLGSIITSGLYIAATVSLISSQQV